MIGERIRILRLEKNLTQKELGIVFNKTKNNISQYETGKREPDNDTINQIADFFDVSVDYIFGRTNDRKGYVEPDEGISKDNIRYKTYEEMLNRLKYLLEREGIIAEADPVPKEAIELIFKHGGAAAIDILKLKLTDKNNQI